MTDSMPVDVQTRLAIEALVHRHAWLIDHGRAQELPALFTEDARMFGVGPDKSGRAEIAAWADQRAAMASRRSRHVQTNIHLEAASADTVTGTVILLLFRHDGEGAGAPAPLAVGEYADLYRLGSDGVWRFAERRLTILFGSP